MGNSLCLWLYTVLLLLSPLLPKVKSMLKLFLNKLQHCFKNIFKIKYQHCDKYISKVWWLTSVILALEKLRKYCHKFKAIMGYICEF